MAEYYDEQSYGYANPYAVAPAQNVSMIEKSRHEDGNALAANAEARAIAEVKAQVLMARQFPRDAALAVDRIIGECKRPTLAEAAVYTFPRGKESVTGPSIRLAEVLARNWGNNTFGYEVLERKATQNGHAGSSVIRAYAWDLETNTYISRQFEISHWRQTRSGGYAITEDRDIYELESNMASRRMRACILQMIPGDITAAAVAACRQTEATGLSQKMADKNERAKMISGTIKVFEKMGVAQSDLEGLLKANVTDWTADHMLKLKEVVNAIRDNVSTIGDYFPHLAGNEKDAVISKEQVEKLMSAAKETGKQGQISDAMKQLGIAKYADVPAARFDEVMALIHSFAPEKQTAAIESGDNAAAEHNSKKA